MFICMNHLFRWQADALNPIALRKAKIVCNFGLSECNRVKLIVLNPAIVLNLPQALIL